MKHELELMPVEVRRKIQEGEFNLFRVKCWTAPSVEFLLLTDTGDTYVMDQRGKILECKPLLGKDVEIVDTITLNN